jgi:hypothetical protein
MEMARLVHCMHSNLNRSTHNMNRNNTARKHESGTYAIALPPSSEAPSDLIAQELRARLASMPTSDLVELLRESVMPTAIPEAPAATPTVRQLIKQVLGRGSLPSQEVVRRVQALRPGTPGPTVRSDLSRMRVEGQLRAVGPVRGGKLRVG